jgi:hypothetical protein
MQTVVRYGVGVNVHTSLSLQATLCFLCIGALDLIALTLT